jgi:farnesyl-diphosphate farnesyltransferase
MTTTEAQSSRIDPREMLRLVSRTFALSIEQLPALLRESIGVAYLMFRVSDFLEDNEIMAAERKAELLTLWSDILSGQVAPERLTALLTDVDSTDPEAAVAQHADQVLALLAKLPPEIQDTIRNEVRESSLGMARWQLRGPNVLDEADLDDYMFEVAGRVGLMLTRIFALHYRPIAEMKDQLMPLGKEFGLALQTVNVIRGLRKDFERGWIFVPESLCTQAGIKPPDLFAPDKMEEAMHVVEALSNKAERHLRNGLQYIKLIPRRYHRLRLACMWPLFFAARTLAISRSDRRVLQSEAKITRDEVKQIILDTQVGGWSNTWMEQYFERLSAG